MFGSIAVLFVEFWCWLCILTEKKKKKIEPNHGQKKTFYVFDAMRPTKVSVESPNHSFILLCVRNGIRMRRVKKISMRIVAGIVCVYAYELLFVLGMKFSFCVWFEMRHHTNVNRISVRILGIDFIRFRYMRMLICKFDFLLLVTLAVKQVSENAFFYSHFSIYRQIILFCLQNAFKQTQFNQNILLLINNKMR